MPISLKDPMFRNTLILLIINGLALLAYHKANPGKNVERYYMENNQMFKFYAVKFAYTALFVSFLVNMRYLSRECLKQGVAFTKATVLAPLLSAKR